jgi:hypothetical protein
VQRRAEPIAYVLARDLVGAADVDPRQHTARLSEAASQLLHPALVASSTIGRFL